MTNDKWQMANDKWQMTNDKWQMANIKWQYTIDNYQMANPYRALGTMWQISNGKCRSSTDGLPFVTRRLGGICHLSFVICHLSFAICHLLFDSP
jgi:hypothetical protein